MAICGCSEVSANYPDKLGLLVLIAILVLIVRHLLLWASEITFGHVEVISPWSTYIQGKGVRSEGQNGDSHHLPFPRDALEVIHELGDMRVEGHERTI